MTHLTPDGTLDMEITLPVSQPTMPAFGGEDMQTMFITSARQNLTDNDMQVEPLAGALLMLKVPYKGSPVHSLSM